MFYAIMVKKMPFIDDMEGYLVVQTIRCLIVGFFKWRDLELSERAKFFIYELKKEHKEMIKFSRSRSDEKFVIKEVGLEMKLMKKQLNITMKNVEDLKRKKMVY